MSINLQKGQKINLSKDSRSGLNKVMVGLGWDEVPQKRGLFAPKPQDIDCDAFAILLGYDGKLLNHTNELKQCTVFFNNLVWPGGSIRHMGDNLTGAGEGDDEQIFVDLQNVPLEVGTIVFAVNIYDAFKRNQNFGMIRNAFIRLVDVDTGTEICRFNLSENYNGMTGLVVGEIYKRNGDWKFNAIGQPVQEASRLDSLIRLYI